MSEMTDLEQRGAAATAKVSAARAGLDQALRERDREVAAAYADKTKPSMIARAYSMSVSNVRAICDRAAWREQRT